jgi:hypothetical protein
VEGILLKLLTSAVLILAELVAARLLGAMLRRNAAVTG